jgi:hypothetical protein
MAQWVEANDGPDDPRQLTRAGLAGCLADMNKEEILHRLDASSGRCSSSSAGSFARRKSTDRR